jgi:TolB-like protein
MRKRWACTLIALMLLPALTAGQDSRPGIAVSAWENGGSYGQEKEDFEALGVGLQQMLMNELSQNGALRVVDRAELKTLMGEQDLGASGRVDEATAARIGKLVGAKYFVMGAFIDWYGDMQLVARVVNTETGELGTTARARGEREELFSLVVELAGGITENLSLPSLSQQVKREREERAERIPHEAVRLYTKALLYADRGERDRAIELFNQITTDFPQYTEAGEALEQLRSGA